MSPPTYIAVRSLFLRSLACIYLVAFASLWFQIEGLIGENGLAPAAEYFGAIRARHGAAGFFSYPSLLLMTAAGNGMLGAFCVAGMLAALGLAVGLVPLVTLFACWALYLSLFVAGQVFLGFQWDILLLETGVIALFAAPLCLGPGGWKRRPPSVVFVWLLRWLLFRLMFASGVVKLASGDAAWWDLSALAYHYESQPLPPWTAWWMHQLPPLLHRASCAFMFFIELVVPFFVFGTRRFRLAAFVLFTAFQLVIIATGNYTFFNWLTIVLGFSLLDDQALGRVSASINETTAPLRGTASLHLAATVCSVGLALCLGILSTTVFAGRLIGWDRVPATLRVVAATAAPLRLTSAYGLFAVMTKGRPEIVMEGSDDGLVWREYGFRYKPGDLSRRPRFVAPHQPRLDWQMWFAALSDYRSQRWLSRLTGRLLEAEPSVLALLSHDPFQGRRPTFIRALLYDYSFSSPGAQKGEAVGTWWTRSNPRLYHPMVRRR